METSAEIRDQEARRCADCIGAGERCQLHCVPAVAGWKYHILHRAKPISENDLARMGEQGWELAGCATRQRLFNPSHLLDVRTVVEYIYYFKMPKRLHPA